MSDLYWLTDEQMARLQPCFPIAGVRFSCGVNAQEVDNVVFAGPEPTTWALMLVGFGMVGAVTRYRRRKSTVAFGGSTNPLRGRGVRGAVEVM